MFTRLAQFSRGYMSPYRLPVWKHDVFTYTLPNLINCRQHKEFLQVNEDQLLPHFLSASISVIVNYDLDLDEHWPEICQLVKRQIATYDYFVVNSLYDIARSFAILGEKNDEFWQIVEKKLVGENLYKFLTESQAARLMRGLSLVGKGSDELWGKLESVVKKYHMTLDANDINEAVDAYIATGRGNSEAMKLFANHPDFRIAIPEY